MKLTIFLFFLSMFGVMAHTNAQKISLNVTSAPLKQVLLEITKQSGYTFIYEEDDVSLTKSITIKVMNKELKEVLPLLLKDQALNYTVGEKSIVVKKKVETILVLAYEEVRGRVVDSLGRPLVGASVRVINSDGQKTALQTKTDSEGQFILNNVPEGGVLLISFVGYENKEVKAIKDIGIVMLIPSSGELEEVMVNKGYYTESRRLSTGSVGSVDAEIIAQQPVTNVMGALIGRIPGLEITQAGGMPGAGFKVRIRGQNSIAGGNNPLFIVDGVPFASESMGNSQVSRHLPYIDGNSAVSPFNTLNPADIASIEVLKDADATAIYGSRGANGVILITTKKGQGGKAQVDINVNSSFSKVTHLIEMLNTEEYLAIRKEAYANDGITSDYPSEAFDINGTWDPEKYTDWKKELLSNTAKVLNLQGGISGGSDRTQFLVRGGYQRESTIFPGDFHYDRGSVLVNLNHRSTDDKFSLALSSNYSTDKNDMVGSDITMQVGFLAPNAPDLYMENGDLNWANSTWTNPLSHLEIGYGSNTKNSNNNLQMDYKLLPNLMVKLSLGYNDNRLDEFFTNPSTIYDPVWEATSANSYMFETIGSRQSWIAEPQITWKKELGKGQIQALIGSTFQQQSGGRKVQFGSGFPSNALIYDITAASDQYIYVSENTLYKYNAVFGRLNYNWESKYLVNLTARRDGSSRFSPENQFANFGAVGAAWVFSNEPFLRQLLPFISFGKLRGSYGVTGNDQIGDYQFLNTFAPESGNNYQDIVGLLPQRLYNPDFGWETNRKLEAALEFALFDDHVSVTAAWYRNRSSNQLVGIPLSGITGFTSIQSNLDAEVQNTGWELEVQYTPIRMEKVRWHVGANVTIPKNKLLSFPGLETSSYSNTYVVGQPLSIVKRYNMTGVDPQTGIYHYLDVNDDGQLSSTYDRTSLHNLASHFYGSATSNLTVGNWQFDAFFQFVKKTGQNFLYSVSTPASFLAGIPKVAVENRWVPGKTDATIQILTAGGNQEAMNAADRIYVSDAAVSDIYFIRLKNVALSYQLPKAWLKNVTGRVFVQGQNLWTLTDFEGNDPENESLQKLPALKTINIGFQLTL